ncbi:MAG: TrkA C-terminal domain-containing protein [Actinomycetes bacterium]
MLAILSLLVIVTLSLLVTRVATTVLTLTGMSRESARFQARSALTGSGFTTSESESVVNHPVRRRVIMTLMLVGSVGTVSVLASLLLSLVGSGGARDTTQRLAVLLAGLAVLLWLARNPRVDRGLERLIRRLLRRYTDLDVRDYASLLQIHGDYSVSELEVRPGDWLADRSLADLGLSEEGILVLGIQRDHGAGGYEGAPRGSCVVRPADVLILYGPGERLADLDERPAGAAGDAARERAVADQRAREGSGA